MSTTNGRGMVIGTVVALAVGLAGAGSAASAAPERHAPQPPSVGEPYKRTELYFGGVEPGGDVITPSEFELFLDNEVTPAFPDGLTWLEAHGQWRGGKESSYLLIILYPAGDRHANRELEEIREDYKRQFGQESVLRADSTDRVSF